MLAATVLLSVSMNLMTLGTSCKQKHTLFVLLCLAYFIEHNVQASLVAQTVKNLPAMQKTWVQSLGAEDPLENGVATYSSILVWRIPMDREAWQAKVMESQKVIHD